MFIMVELKSPPSPETETTNLIQTEDEDVYYLCSDFNAHTVCFI